MKRAIVKVIMLCTKRTLRRVLRVLWSSFKYVFRNMIQLMELTRPKAGPMVQLRMSPNIFRDETRLIPCLVYYFVGKGTLFLSLLVRKRLFLSDVLQLLIIV